MQKEDLPVLPVRKETGGGERHVSTSSSELAIHPVQTVKMESCCNEVVSTRRYIDWEDSENVWVPHTIYILS